MGERLSTQKVAEILGIDPRTVRNFYEDLGGVRVGRRIIFFERRLIDALKNKENHDCDTSVSARCGQNEINKQQVFGSNNIRGKQTTGRGKKDCNR